ncbi:type IV secretion system protein [Caulobacter segnis]|uniref:type IV secretion system protein n=1 Tax=Caulobacter segnis TaxID=88688 RepID=UPI00240F2DCF|nr:type IV secretion system protein [Caulobacter segnis]MDG2520514.1 type IV secretion system protein [Caulobacter segnis]
MRRLLCGVVACAVLAMSHPARAAVIVHDPVAYAKIIDEVRAAIEQLDTLKAQLAEGKRLHDSLNLRSAIDAIAPELSAPELRKALPDVSALEQAASGRFEALGAIGDRARQIREARRKLAPAAGEEASPLARQGDLAARDLAVGEAAVRASSERLTGLRALQAAVGQADSARAVADLQARIAAEQALILNDQMKLQALALAQAAEERMERQEARERSAQRRRDRMELARRTFQ